MPGDKNVEGVSPLPARIPLLKRLYHLPSGTSGSDSSQCFNSRKVGSRHAAPLQVTLDEMFQNSRWRRLLDFGHGQLRRDTEDSGSQVLKLRALELLMENRAFQLTGKSPNLAWVGRAFETLQQGQNSLIGCLLGTGNRHCLHLRTAFFGLRPSRLDSLTRAFAPLFRSHPGSSSRPPLLATPSPESNSGGILLRRSNSHTYIIPERSRIDT